MFWWGKLQMSGIFSTPPHKIEVFFVNSQHKFQSKYRCYRGTLAELLTAFKFSDDRRLSISVKHNIMSILVVFIFGFYAHEIFREASLTPSPLPIFVFQIAKIIDRLLRFQPYMVFIHYPIRISSSQLKHILISIPKSNTFSRPIIPASSSESTQ